MNFLSCQQENPEFLNNYLKYKRFIEFGAETTVNETYFDLRTFFRYIKLKDNNEILSRDLMKNTSIVDITTKDFITITKKDIEDYIFFLKNDLENSIKTRNRKLATLKKFFQYLLNNNYITVDPTKFIKSGQTEKRLSKHLNLNESKKLLSITITKNSRNNIRNYAIICLFLNCCLRLSELVNINITDIKFGDRTLKITGKGNKQRITYLNDATIEAIKKYLEIRPTLDKTDINYNALFLSERRKRISRRNVQVVIENSIKIAFDNNKDKLHTHSLRHTGATLLYDENDVNILIIQKILGHKHLSSTEIYTHISDKKLRKIMNNCTISSILEKMEETKNGKI